MKDFSIEKAFKASWQAFKANWMLVLAVGFVMVVVQWLPGLLTELGIVSETGLSMALVSLVSTIFGLILTMGWIYIAIKLMRGESAEFSDLWSKTDRLVPYFLASLLVGVLVGLGLILLIVPGIILALMYMYVPYIIVDTKAGVMDALKQSSELTKGIRMKLLGFVVVIIGLNIVGAMLFGLGLILTIPLSALAQAYVYNRLLGRTETVVVEAEVIEE